MMIGYLFELHDAGAGDWSAGSAASRRGHQLRAQPALLSPGNQYRTFPLTK